MQAGFEFGEGGCFLAGLRPGGQGKNFIGAAPAPDECCGKAEPAADIATQTTKVDFARYDEHGHKQDLQKPALRFRKLKAMKYLFCSFHGAVVSVGEVSLTCRSKIPSSEHDTFLSKFVRTIVKTTWQQVGGGCEICKN